MRSSWTRVRVAAGASLVTLALAPTAGAAQSLDLLSVAAPELLLPPAYSDPETLIGLVSDLREHDPENVDLYLAEAREATALGVLDETPELREAWLQRAEEAARAAVALDSTSVDASYWLAAALGLRADLEGGRSKISLAREAHLHATRALELDPGHPGANHLVGRLHSGARRLSWLNRLVARGLGLGEILSEASWESAERHMRLAAEGDPDQLAHLHDLGKLLLQQRIDEEEGRAILEDLAARTPRHELDALYIRRSEEVLAQLGRR